MQDAALDFDDIEAVVYSLSPDSMVESAMPTSRHRCGRGAQQALPAHQHWRLDRHFERSGRLLSHCGRRCDVVLTAGADKVGECGDSQTILNKIWIPPTSDRCLSGLSPC